MQRFILILLFIVCYSCSSPESKRIESELKQFNLFLGSQKAETLDGAVKSFNKFLKKNYRSNKGYNQKVIACIQDLSANEFRPIDNWIIDTTEIREIYIQFEESELRMDFYRFGYETNDYNNEVVDIYEHVMDSIWCRSKDLPSLGEIADLDLEQETIPLTHPISDLPDSLIEQERIKDSIHQANYLYTAKYSTFYAGLFKYAKSDTIIQDIAFSHLVAGDIPPSLKAEAYIKMKEDIDFRNPFFQRIIVVDFYCPYVFSKLFNHS